MGSILRILLGRPLLRPLARFIVGALAIPIFRLFLRKVIRLQELDRELEKDLEQWFRGALLLLVATRNMEESLFGWVGDLWEGDWRWVTLGFRLMLAITVIEAMPDQELFAIIHASTPKFQFSFKEGIWAGIKRQFRPFLKAIVCQHINRSSPVFAFLSAIAPGWVGWFCYGMALFQYLIIGLVTSRDKALDVLSEFDRQVAMRRRELVQELDYDERPGEEIDADELPRGAPARQLDEQGDETSTTG